ncbi:MAG: hypothetical protein OSA98_25310, partial [Rubripirellula sp.]|nr:hypothetical protein [Rubripirellula sp.]
PLTLTPLTLTPWLDPKIRVRAAHLRTHGDQKKDRVGISTKRSIQLINTTGKSNDAERVVAAVRAVDTERVSTDRQ